MPARLPAPSGAFLRRRLAIPTEHGAWSWWLVPLLVGLAAAPRPAVDHLALAALALVTFLAHQPATVAVKAATGRGARADRLPALAWTGLYGLLAAALLAWLLVRGHAVVLVPVAAGLLLFPLHLRLVARKAERRQLGFELAGATALALWAPAAVLVGADGAEGAEGAAIPLAVWLWALTALFSAGAILSVYARLGARAWKEPPPLARRLRLAAPTVLLHTAALVLALVFFADRPVGPGHVAFVPSWVDAWRVALAPRPRAMPRQIGIHYLALATVFTLLMAAAFLGPWRP